jgi:glycine/D-amino acid oxidase-like deaminating enzyme
MTATHPLRLRAGRSIWQLRRLPAIPSKTLNRSQTCDVAIIGAGISGAMVADALSADGLNVLVIDRRRPLTGSTAASTALLQYEIDTPLCVLIKKLGLERAQRIWRRSRLALAALRERIHHLGIDADVEERSSLYLEGNLLDAGGLRIEAEARRQAGFEISMLPRGQVMERFGIPSRAAILGHGNLTADPRRLAAGFLRAALKRGTRLCCPVEVLNVDAQSDIVRLETSEGHRIDAHHVVFATGFELAKGVPRKGHTISSTWALATRPQPARLWPGLCTIWEASDPYLYLRAGPDGRIICGGEDEDFQDEDRRDALLQSKVATLEVKLNRLLPGIDARHEYAWCGSFGGSRSGTPTIGRVPSMPNCYAVLGYGGNGITFSMLAAQMLRSAIGGIPDPDADLFSFGRKFV